MRSIFYVLSVLLLFPLGPLVAQRSTTTAPKPARKAAAAAQKPAYPEILEVNEGEQRVRRPRELPISAGSFIFKVDRENGRSRQMWLGTEDIKPGASIPKHRHLGQDEILLVRSGQAHVNVGDLDRDANTGAIIFIPAGTWITLTNTGKENLDLAFIFSAPGFDEFLRCTSVPVGKPATPMTTKELRQCAHAGHVEYEALEGDQTKP